jgi:peptidoglycan/xylan/chitin deacetylase (PgdA/CDA1 family)
MSEKLHDNVSFPGEGDPERIKVLIYHLVNGERTICEKNKKMCIHIDDFRNHLKFLDKWGYTAITFKDYQLYLEGELNLPKKPIIITFDDGYSETAKYTFPALKEFGMKAVYFVLGDRKIKTNIWDKDMFSFPLSLMNDEQILELHQAGFEIGSHSMRHSLLPRVSREQAWEEISRSRMSLEILLNAPVKSFAYPFGQLDETSKKMVKDSGYLFGCATFTGPPKFVSDPFEIRRILIPGGMSMINFAIRVFLPYQYYNYFYREIKKIFLLKWNRNRTENYSYEDSPIDKTPKDSDS